MKNEKSEQFRITYMAYMGWFDSNKFYSYD